ncbi:MAG: hypothetical protein OXF20_05615 [Gammaproteobacteria bacterium]|nr:hypothetical protein [Gammaproteobacteria bacterium]
MSIWQQPSGPGVASQPEIVEDASRVVPESFNLFRDRLTIALLTMAQQGQGKTSHAGHVFQTVPTADATAVLIEGMRIVQHLMGGLDWPVSSAGFQNFFCGCLILVPLSTSTGNES